MSSILARVCHLSKNTRSSETGGSDASWFLVAGSLGLLGASVGLGVGCYLASLKNERVRRRRMDLHRQHQQQLAVGYVERQTRAVIPGDFEDLNEGIIGLIRGEVCDMTGQLQEALRRREALSNQKQVLEERWNGVLGGKCLELSVENSETSPAKSPSLFQNEVDLEICSGVVNDLRQKIAVLQSYLDRGKPVLQLPNDADNPPEIFTCPITFDVMHSPVVAADGFTYEEESIRKWLRTSRVSPRTNEEMRSTLLQPNNALRLAIARWRDEARPAPSKPSWDLVAT